MIVTVVAERMNKDGSAAVAQRRTRPGTMKVEEEEENKYVVLTKDTQYKFVAEEDETRYTVWTKEEEMTRPRVSR